MLVEQRERGRERRKKVHGKTLRKEEKKWVFNRDMMVVGWKMFRERERERERERGYGGF